ncbi:MAG TPA: hypothetical protein VKP11_01485, partial [Frankiaceae bacterium]|nr:hypothetical protein [Frankiaceae bacterium]
MAATVAQAVRQHGTPAYDSIWAEDGHAFLTDAIADPWDVGRPLANYLQVLPRIIAGLIVQVPLSHAAGLVASSAAMVVALVSVYVFLASRPLLPVTWQRAALAVVFVAAPWAGFETNATINNLHWYLNFAAFFALAPWA